MALLLQFELSQQGNRRLSLLSETLQGARVWFNMYELIHARWLLDRWTEVKEREWKKIEKVQRNREKERRFLNCTDGYIYIKRQNEKKEWDRMNIKVSEWKKNRRKKTKSRTMCEDERRVVSPQNWIYVCIFMNTPLKSKYMTALMGYWSAHRIWWMELK